MKIKEIWAEYSQCTKELTEFGRKLAFGAAAICWFFKGPDATFPTLIYYSLLSVVLFFIFDISQFLTSALTIKFWVKGKEKEIIKKKKKLEEAEIDKPTWLPKAPFILFLIKIIFLFISYFWLGIEFCTRIN